MNRLDSQGIIADFITSDALVQRLKVVADEMEEAQVGGFGTIRTAADTIEAQDEAWAAWLVEQGYGYDWIATPLPPVAVRRKVELLYAERDGCSVDDVEWAMVQEFGDAWLTRQEAEG